MWQLTKNIILEGPDLAGKSTLKEALIERLQLPARAERIGRIADPCAKVAIAFADVTRTEHMILDRCHFISDMMYEQVLGHAPSVFWDCYPTVVNTLREHCVVIYVETSTGELRARYEERGDDMRSWQEIDGAAKAYQDFFSDAPGFPVITMTGKLDDESFNDLIHQLHHWGVIKWVFTEVREASIQSIYDKIDWKITSLGDRTTIVQAILPNGYILTESSTSATTANFSMKVGVEMCKERIKNQLWALEAYRLRGEN